MSIELKHDTPFSLDHTLDCGQVFRWNRGDGFWLGIVDASIVKVAQRENRLTFNIYPKDKAKEKEEAFIRRYFRLDDNLPHVLACINRDEAIAKAIKELCGLRLIRQDTWECLISFICATYANIPRIKKMIERLSRSFGEKISCEECIFYTFPSREALAKATLRELKECGLGFRARYVFETTRMLHGFNLESLRDMSYEDARKRLMTLAGVGGKVADCVLLFSLDKLEAFPVDVWISRIVSEHYANRLPAAQLKSFKKVSEFGRAYFGEYAGYAQEYLYHYYRLRRSIS